MFWIDLLASKKRTKKPTVESVGFFFFYFTSLLFPSLLFSSKGNSRNVP